MNRWIINDIDITKEFGVFLKKGSYANLIKYSDSKDYLTEEVRDIDGENVFLRNTRLKSRDVDLYFYMNANDPEDFFRKRDMFISFLRNGILRFRIVKHNRTHLLYYKSCKSFKGLTSFKKTIWFELSITFREPNPSKILKEDILQTEQGIDLKYENNKSILIETSQQL